LDILTCQKQDVAELTWHYTNSFWPEYFESMQDYINGIKAQINTDGFYDVTL
jgi:hypothetical protein